MRRSFSSCRKPAAGRGRAAWGIPPNFPLGRPAVPQQVARAGAVAPGAVVRVRERTAVEREAAAADALGEALLEALELGDARVDADGPGARQLRPVGARRHAVLGQLG